MRRYNYYKVVLIFVRVDEIRGEVNGLLAFIGSKGNIIEISGGVEQAEQIMRNRFLACIHYNL